MVWPFSSTMMLAARRIGSLRPSYSASSVSVSTGWPVSMTFSVMDWPSRL